jgi:hypothetical protein
VDQRPTTPSTEASTERPADPAAPSAVPRSVELAIRATWGLVLVTALLVVLLWVFSDELIGSWASGHEGAREVFDQGGREALERAGFAPPSFVAVAATMLVVGAMLVWVLAAMLRQGHRWGQLALCALLIGSAYVSVALGFVLEPPPVFVVLAAVSLLVEGVACVCLWHPDTRRYLAGSWVEPADGAMRSGADGAAVNGDGPAGTPGSTEGASGSADRSA